MADQENVPENALFVCFGVMSSTGTLTGIAVLEAMKKLDPKKIGLFCTSALAVDVPKHMKTTQAAKRIIAILQCPKLPIQQFSPKLLSAMLIFMSAKMP